MFAANSMLGQWQWFPTCKGFISYILHCRSSSFLNGNLIPISDHLLNLVPEEMRPNLNDLVMLNKTRISWAIWGQYFRQITFIARTANQLQLYSDHGLSFVHRCEQSRELGRQATEKMPPSSATLEISDLLTSFSCLLWDKYLVYLFCAIQNQQLTN